MPLNNPARGERLQRVMADAGVAARRQCEALIEQGLVKVNGRKADRLPIFVDPATDKIEVQGRPLRPPERLLYIMLNKPTRTLGQPGERADDDRPRAIDLIDHPAKPRLVAVGGLDFDTTGLMLFTNDGELVNRLTHPKFGATRIYEAVVRGQMKGETIRSLSKGIFVIDEDAQKAKEEASAAAAAASAAPRPHGSKAGNRKAITKRTPKRSGLAAGGNSGRGSDDERTTRSRKVHLDVRVAAASAERSTLEITVRVGRDDEILTALQIVGHPVKRLTRIGIGGLKLRELAMGRWRELNKIELNAIRKGLKRSEATGGRAAAPEQRVVTTGPIEQPMMGGMDVSSRKPRVISDK